MMQTLLCDLKSLQSKARKDTDRLPVPAVGQGHTQCQVVERTLTWELLFSLEKWAIMRGEAETPSAAPLAPPAW